MKNLRRFNENLEKTFQVPAEFTILVQDIGPNPTTSDIISCWNDCIEDNPIRYYHEGSNKFILEDGESTPEDVFICLNDYLMGDEDDYMGESKVNDSEMKRIKKFNNYVKVNEEFFALAALGGIIGAMAIPSAYEWAKNFWSKNVVGSKYQETGRKEVIVTKLPEKIAVTIILSKQEREAGEVRTELKEYKDNLGNIFWGYDHLWADGDSYYDYEAYLNDADIYTALYKEEDLAALKSFLQNPIRYTGSYDITKPNPIEMIYVEEGPKHPVGNY